MSESSEFNETIYSNKKRGRNGESNSLPPLPSEEDFFTPSMKSGIRSLKSISLLTEEFISKMPKHQECPNFHIRQLANELKVDIKRIYTILNVLEAVMVVQRKGKDVYQWNGTQNLTVPLIKLAQLAHRDNMSQLMFMEAINGQVCSDTSDGKKEKCQMSISTLTQKLLMIFLVLPQPKMLALSVAVSILYGNGTAAKSKQGCSQKLGDICKVLQVIGLIQKVEISNLDTSIPIKAFKYIGVDIEVVDNGCSKSKEINDVNECKKESLSCEGGLYCNVKALPPSSSDDDAMPYLKQNDEFGMLDREGQNMNC